jgi:hypothetical protein
MKFPGKQSHGRAIDLVIPAKAGIQVRAVFWAPASAGATALWFRPEARV